MATARPNNRAPSRAAAAARSSLLDALKADHKRVKKAYRDFQKLQDQDAADGEQAEAIVRQVCAELTVHATLEEELLYPAARTAIDAAQIDEAEVEHASVKDLIAQLDAMANGDDKFAARFTVLCEYVQHHVKEEETEMFPALERARGIDWEPLQLQAEQRRSELMQQLLPEPAQDSETAMADGEDGGGSDDAATSASGRKRSSSRSPSSSAKAAASSRSR